MEMEDGVKEGKEEVLNDTQEAVEQNHEMLGVGPELGESFY